MNASDVLRNIWEAGIIPVVRAADPDAARLAVDALVAGGTKVVEITMTVPNASAVIRKVADEYRGKIVVGAGTVLTHAQAQSCIDFGAEFLVSPGLSPRVLHCAWNQGKLAIPGALTPTEIIAATDEGAEVVKVFPCGNVGGPKYIKSLRGPFPQIKFIPTGGVNISNAADYIAAGAYALGAGSDLVDGKALREGNSTKISEMTREFLETIQRARQQMKVG